MKSELQKWRENESKKEINASIKNLQLKGVYLSRKEIVSRCCASRARAAGG